MKTISLSCLLALCFNVQAGERLEGISGSMKKSISSWGWFFPDDEENSDDKVELEQKEHAKSPTPIQSAVASPASYYDEEADCVMHKAYILDVENPEQYQRLEDYPFTYECAVRR